MFVLKIFGKIMAIPMIIIMTILFYTIFVFSRIYNLAAIVFNLAFMLCAVIALCLQQWHNFGIAVGILVISYMVLGALDVIAGIIAAIKKNFIGVLFA